MRITKNTKNKREEKFFFPRELISRLDGIFDYPLTFVEAPSGFGKTTAVKEYLRDRLPETAREHWHTCLGEPPLKAWEGICRLFGDSVARQTPVHGGETRRDIASRLTELFPPTMESLPDIAALMRECRCEAETFLVIDNYQLFENEIPNELVNAFSVHQCKNLRVIVISQPLSSSKDSVHNANIHRLAPGDFFFDRDSTVRLCRLLGTKLSDEELETVQSSSEGWVAAIRLQIENYIKTGSFTSAYNMDELIKTAIWNRTSEEGRDFLLALSLLDGFTEKQAAVMGNWAALPKSVARLLDGNFFIPYVADKGVYSMHSLLRDYLLKRFEAQPAGFAETMHRRAGSACAVVSDYFQAARFYMKIKDFDAILSMPFTKQYLNSLRETNILELLTRIVDECPEETLLKYPLLIPSFAVHFMRGGKRNYFRRMLETMRKIADEPGMVSESGLSLIRSAFALLMSFTQYNDIAKMSEYHREALKFLSGDPLDAPSAAFVLASSGKETFTFGITSVLCMFWRDVGELDKELSLMDECMPFYYKLTNGNGMGAETVMRAEANLLRGDDAKAETAAYEACYHADGVQQVCIRLCAELVLARVAIFRGNHQAYAKIVRNITRHADAIPGVPLRRLIEFCLATTGLTLGTADGLPDWLRGAESIRKALYVQGQSYGFMLHGRLLLLEKRHAELFALTEPVMSLAREMNYLLPQVCQMIYLAVAKKRSDALTQASEHLSAALDMALPDRVYLPFAELGPELLPLLETVGKNFNAEKMAALRAVCRRQTAGAESVKKHVVKGKSPLTPRERDIALLARQRFSTREIASYLFISENTVNSALRIIYSKLEIHSKAELAKKDF